MLPFFLIQIIVVLQLVCAQSNNDQLIETLRGFKLYKTRNGYFEIKMDRVKVSTFSSGLKYDKKRVDFSFNGEELEIQLSVNENLFAPYYEFFHPDLTRTKSDLRHCYYHGAIKGKMNSLVALSDCDGYHGTLLLDVNERFSIHTSKDRKYIILNRERSIYMNRELLLSEIRSKSRILMKQHDDDVLPIINQTSKVGIAFKDESNVPIVQEEKVHPIAPSNGDDPQENKISHRSIRSIGNKTEPMSNSPPRTIQKKCHSHRNAIRSKKTTNGQGYLRKRNADQPNQWNNGDDTYFDLMLGLTYHPEIKNVFHAEHLIADHVNLLQYYFNTHPFKQVHGSVRPGDHYRFRLSGTHYLGEEAIGSYKLPSYEEEVKKNNTLMNHYIDSSLLSYLNQWGNYSFATNNLMINSDISFLLLRQSGVYHRKTALAANNKNCSQFQNSGFLLIDPHAPHNHYYNVFNMVHELGHILGMDHTCQVESKGSVELQLVGCEDQVTVMNTTSVLIEQWRSFSATSLAQSKCYPAMYHKVHKTIWVDVKMAQNQTEKKIEETSSVLEASPNFITPPT